MLGRMVRPVVSGAAVFDPTTLAWSSLYLPDYAGAPWAATASAGASATTGPLITASSDPTTGTAQNGKVPAHFTGASSHFLQNSTPSSSLFTAGAGTIVALFKAASAAAPNGNTYSDPAFYVDAGVAHLGLTYTTSGFTGFIDDGSTSVVKAAATGSYHLAMFRWNGSLIGLTVDSATEVTTAAGNATMGAGTMQPGRGYSGGCIDGDLLMFGTAAVDLSANYGGIKSYVNATFGLAQ